MAGDVWIIGASMTKFGRYPDKDSIDLASEAALAALDDAGATIHDIQILAAGSLMEASNMLGQRLQKQIGQTGIPVYNVANACATGATAVRTGIMAIKAGEADMALAVGVEQMGKMGLLGSAGQARSAPQGSSPRAATARSCPWRASSGPSSCRASSPRPAWTTPRATTGWASSSSPRWPRRTTPTRRSTPWPSTARCSASTRSWRRPWSPTPTPCSCAAPPVTAPPSVVLCSDAKLKTLDPDVRRRAVKISASVLTSDPYVESDTAQPDVSTLTKQAAAAAYEQAGVSPQDLDLVELHDCFATAELIHYENLQLCEPGGAGDFIDRRGPWRDGATPVNVSGGLISKGHPIGATGVANLYEVATHLRGEAGDRQIEGARVGLTHVIGLGSACGVHVLERAAS